MQAYRQAFKLVRQRYALNVVSRFSRLDTRYYGSQSGNGSGSVNARANRLQALVGAVAVAGAIYLTTASSSTVASNDGPTSALSSKEFRSFEVEDVLTLSHNVKRILLKLPNNASELGLPVCSCVMIRAPDSTEEGGYAVRPYTPVESESHKHCFELVIKTYPGGKLSNFLCSRKPGDKVDIKGPFPKLPYVANEYKELGLIAGGSGLTPMLQLIRKVASNPHDKTKLTFIFANVTKEDIILKEELDRHATSRPGQIKVVYVLNKPPFFWFGEKGNVCSDTIKKHMPSPDTPGSKILVCGPPGMMKAISGDKNPDRSQGPLTGLLKELGYTEANVFKF